MTDLTINIVAIGIEDEFGKVLKSIIEENQLDESYVKLFTNKFPTNPNDFFKKFDVNEITALKMAEQSKMFIKSSINIGLISKIDPCDDTKSYTYIHILEKSNETCSYIPLDIDNRYTTHKYNIAILLGIILQKFYETNQQYIDGHYSKKSIDKFKNMIYGMKFEHLETFVDARKINI